MIAEAFAVALVDETEPIFKKTEFQRARVFALRIVAIVLKDELAERLK